MIVKDKNLGFFKLLCEMRGSIVPTILPQIVFAAFLGVLAKLILMFDLFGSNTKDVMYMEFSPFAALGVAISLFLGFHNNSSYARWWEARIYWGNQVITVRDLVRFLAASVETDGDEGSCGATISSMISSENEDNDVERAVKTLTGEGFNLSKSKHYDSKTMAYTSWQAHIILLTAAHTHAFRSQMRPSCKKDKVSAKDDCYRFLNEDEKIYIQQSKNHANAILMIAAKILSKADIDKYSMIHIQNKIDRLCELQTACERIHNTSLPLAYSLLVHRTTVVYILVLPFAIARLVGWWTPLFTAIVAYTFCGLDELAKQIQEPMQDKPMCIAMSAISRTIEIDCLEALEENIHLIPDFLKPDKADNCLM